jgi:hypothetical protein
MIHSTPDWKGYDAADLSGLLAFTMQNKNKLK